MSEPRFFTVSGRVQGVGFRAATRDKARSLGLAGWVRNRSDGNVELVAEGPHEAIEALRAWLDSGPPAARVNGVKEHDARLSDSADQSPQPMPFEIR